MKFKIDPKTLKNELSFLTSVTTEKDSTLPILANILIESVDDETIRLTGTNLGTSIRTEVEAEVEEEGTMCVGGKRLFDIVKVLESDMDFSVDTNGWIRIKSGTSKYRVAGLDETHFPVVSVLTNTLATIDSEDLAKLVKATKFAISLDESRFALNGVKFIIENDKAQMVATDGHRIAFMEIEADGDLDTLIPATCLNEVAKLPKGMVSIGEDNNHLYFKAGSRYLTSRKIAGTFPNYQMMFNTDGNKELIVDTEAFKKAVQRVSLMSDTRNRAIKFSISEDKLVLSTFVADAGESEDEVDIEYKGDEQEIVINWQYLMSFLNNYENEQLHVSFDGVKKPIQFGYGTDDYKTIIMPMRM